MERGPDSSEQKGSPGEAESRGFVGIVGNSRRSASERSEVFISGSSGIRTMTARKNLPMYHRQALPQSMRGFQATVQTLHGVVEARGWSPTFPHSEADKSSGRRRRSEVSDGDGYLARVGFRLALPRGASVFGTRVGKIRTPFREL